ncbi:MAG: hypothetical protein Q9217_001155 [Psora testacea]
MTTSLPSANARNESSDPASHAMNIYDDPATEGEWLDEEEDDDDDMDFEPATDESEDNEFFDPSEEAEADFHDAEDGMSGIEIEFSVENGDGDEDERDQETVTEEGGEQSTNATAGARGGTRIHVSTQIMQLLGHTGLRQLLAQHRSGGSGTTFLADDDDEEYGSRRRTRPKRTKLNKFPPVPSQEGRRLMEAGVFGTGQCYRDTLRKRNPRLATKLMERELGLEDQNYTRPASIVAQV